jgi:ArsR family transcriptional regulator, arsenate/arsenite/antimonite-responsive transcriptional repressor
MENTLVIAKALADGNRMRVITALLGRDELCVCQIVKVLGLSGATVSRHMSILQRAGLVQSRKDGRWVYYRLAQRFPQTLRQWLAESLASSATIKNDQENLDSIMSHSPEALCQQQKEQKGCHG